MPEFWSIQVGIGVLGKEKAGLDGCCQRSGKNIMEEWYPHDRKTPYGSNSKYRIGSGGNKYTWHSSKRLTAVFLGIEEGGIPYLSQKKSLQAEYYYSYLCQFPRKKSVQQFLC